ncbi:hypothetical protein ACQV5M_21790, partial [Leptospira sp. SA-E8]|uniref:hypothetical protein n=1 Tax=Leptospira sp. SA-E8 TaxID=3422259 RepID=UPI003EB930C9
TLTPGSVVQSSEMERGQPRSRRIASDARDTFELSLYFTTVEQQTNFEDWFDQEINSGVDWFDFTAPRTGTIRHAHFVQGEIGPLKFESNTLAYATRTVKLEFMRSTWGGA